MIEIFIGNVAPSFDTSPNSLKFMRVLHFTIYFFLTKINQPCTSCSTQITWGFIKETVLSITSSGQIGFWEHDIEAWKMQGRARGRKGERKPHHFTSYHHITMEFGGYLLNVARNPTRARARKGEAQGVLSYRKVTGIFDNPHMFYCNRFFFGGRGLVTTVDFQKSG